MYKLNIKTRILAFVVFFELVAYSSIQLFNNYVYKQELVELKAQEIQQIFRVGSEKINSLSLMMERNAIHLAETGERLYDMKQSGIVSASYLTEQYKSILIENFRNFPEAVGGGIWYEPFTYDEKLKYYGPYAYQSGDEIKFTWDLSIASYDYHNMDWYQIASKNNWGRTQDTTKPVLWTTPYVDDAATFSLMMTVDAVMFDKNKRPIGISTVDWSLEHIATFIEQLQVTKNSFSFLIHAQSKQLISYPQALESSDNTSSRPSWFPALIEPLEDDELRTLTDIKINGVYYNIYYTLTKSGFIFGSLSPVSDLEKDINAITLLTLIVGSIIGTIFIAIILIFMRYLFSPFDRVLNLIKASIGHDKNNNNLVTVQSIDYKKLNEFTPIIHALNEVYQQVNSYISDISFNNIKLKKSKLEIKNLNDKLETKVKLRTEQLKLKTQEAQDSLAHLKNTQQQLVEQEKHASLGRLVAGVSHEINTPLGISITAVTILEDDINFINEKVKTQSLKKSDFDKTYKRIIDSAKMLHENLNKTSELVASFKQVAVDQSLDDFRQFDLIDYLTNNLRTLRPKVSQASHTLSFTHSDVDVQLFSNPGAISLVITNIVDNALEHGFQGIKDGQITVVVNSKFDDIEIIITDNGIGMPTDTVDLIFDPFFTTTRNVGNSGLGMHIVYNLITQQLHGNIECTSEQQQGTSFIITLPKGLHE